MIDESELEFHFIRADGPGGQNVNKVATSVQLRFNIPNSNSLSQETKTRLIKLAGKRINHEGVLMIEAKRYRTQEANREDAIARFNRLLQKALVSPKKRKETKPTVAAKERRLKSKKLRGTIKKARANHLFDEE